MDKLHHIVAEIKRYYQDYGKPPSISELRVMGHSKYIIEKHTMRQLCEMAGVNEVRVNVNEVKKITNDIFKKDISKQLEEYRPIKEIEKKSYPKILCIPDTHYPWVHQESLNAMYEFAKDFKPEIIVQLGDSVDFYSQSKHPKSLNVYTPKEEERLAREGLEKMWEDLKVIAPRAECYLLRGNHCARGQKRVIEAMPSVEHWIDGYMKDYFTFDGVTTLHDTRDALEIQDIVFIHGFLGREGSHRDYFLKNVVHGHLHKLWIQYRRFHRQSFWELCCGFMGDPHAKALSYMPTKETNYQLGWGVIDKYGPRTISL
jgi:UDP-2,3-diacylglucosamine pyrophosphatase LpxH